MQSTPILPISTACPPRLGIQPYLVTAQQMQQIEKRLFDAGMPVAALMEKVSGKITQWFLSHYEKLGREEPGGKLASEKSLGEIGVFAGPGHNGGDALSVARELHCKGYAVRVYQPFSTCKSLTQQHQDYAKSLGIPFAHAAADLAACDAIIDGCFGFGLTRAITGTLAADIQTLNQQNIPVFSIDLPSGIHTDSGQVMGVALNATHTACLGLWKQAFMQKTALTYFGQSELIDFDIPLTDIAAVLGKTPEVQSITAREAIAHLPLNRSATAHKYTAGHLLVIAGSRQYAGAALLAGLGASASGVGMLTLAVPESIRLTLLPQLPNALIVGCPETDLGAISHLPDTVDVSQYDAIAIGPGLTPTVPALVAQALTSPCPLLLDADALNLLAQSHPISQLRSRPAPTILTPHLGEFKRLFPNIYNENMDSDQINTLPGNIARQAAQISHATILLKGPRSAIAQAPTDHSISQLWFNPHSTPALARGGSGDVLTGLMGGLLATAARSKSWQTHPGLLTSSVLSAVWWHSQAALYASAQRTLLGVDPQHLAQALNPALQAALGSHP